MAKNSHSLYKEHTHKDTALKLHEVSHEQKNTVIKGERKYLRGETVAHATRFRAVLQLCRMICEIPLAHMVRHQF